MVLLAEVGNGFGVDNVSERVRRRFDPLLKGEVKGTLLAISCSRNRHNFPASDNNSYFPNAATQKA